MTDNHCGHTVCQFRYRCQYDNALLGGAAMDQDDGPTYSVKAWFREHPAPDEDQQPAGSQPQQEDSDVIEKIPESTHQDDALDTLVSRASIPNLGALIKQGIKQGLIAPTATYR